QALHRLRDRVVPGQAVRRARVADARRARRKDTRGADHAASAFPSGARRPPRVHPRRRPPRGRGGAPMTRPLPEEARVAVIGAGIQGLAIAYNLARLGVERIVVVDQSYLCGGASGRNGGGVRAQWSSETNIRLMRESIRICEEFATKMRINVWFR